MIRIYRFIVILALYALFLTIFFFTTSIPAFSQTDLVGYWPLDEGHGEIVHDFSGNENHGVLNAIAWVPGKFGTALYGTIANIPDSLTLDLPQEFTITAWVKPHNVCQETYGRLITKGEDSAPEHNNYDLYIKPGRIYRIEYEDGSDAENGAESPPDTVINDVWQHVAAVKTIELLQLYIDGELVARSAISRLPVPGSAGLKLNSHIAALDEIRIYNSPLTAEEIQGVMNERFIPPERGYSTEILYLFPVQGAQPGDTIKLWAYIEKTGGEPLPSSAKVGFYVTGPGDRQYGLVGMVDISRLSPRRARLFRLLWEIPVDIGNSDLAYWARCYDELGPLSNEWFGPAIINLQDKPEYYIFGGANYRMTKQK